MAQTITSVKNSASVCQVVVGRYLDTGTVAAYKFTTGFRPLYVKVQNLAATGATIEWYRGMADASAWKSVVAGDGSLITTLGITPAADGFTFGLDTDTNVTSEQVSWLAIG